MFLKGPITGTFIDEITYDIPSSNWSQEQWKRDLDHMRQIGIDTLIFIRGGFGDKTIYPSDYFGTKYADDFAGFLLTEASQRGMTVLMGLYISTINWNGGDAAREIEYNRHFIDEVWQRYGDMPAFGGWYIPQETSHNCLNITEVMRGLSSLCKEKAPNLPVMISPFFHTPITGGNFTVEQHCQEWDNIFHYCGKEIDICAFQDGTASLKEMREYYMATKALCERHGIHHWVNTETFERDVRHMYYPIPFSVLKQKLALHQEYAEKVITFEFSHFLSPQSIYPSAHNLYARYTDFYKETK